MQAFRFSNFEFEPLSGRLTRDGQPVALRPQPAALLALLLRNRGRVITKQEILDTVWCDTYVQDQSLFQSIAELRKSLGDSARQPRFVKTVARRGYRWIDQSTTEVLTAAPGELEPGADEQVAEPTLVAEAPPDPAASDQTNDQTNDQTGTDSRTETILHADPHASPSKRRSAVQRLLSRPALVIGMIALMALVWAGWRLLAARGTRPSRVVAILPFVNATGDSELDWVAYGLMDLVSRRLQEHQGLSLIGIEQIVRTETELARHSDTTRQEAWAEGLRRAYGPLWVISARLEAGGTGDHKEEAYRLAFQLEARDGTLESQVLTGPDPIALARTLADRVAEEVVAPGLRLTSHGESGDEFLAEVYAKGIHQLYRGGAKRAIPYFRVVLDHEPGSLLAKVQLAICYEKLAEYELSEQLTREVLADQATRDDPTIEGKALTNLGTLAFHRQDWATATDGYERALKVLEAGGDRRAQAWALGNLGNIAIVKGNLEQSRDYLERSLATFRELGDRIGEGNALGNLALVAQSTGKLGEARRLYTESIGLRRLIGDRKGLGWALVALGQLERQQGNLDRAAGLLNEALKLQLDLGDRLNSMRALVSLGSIARVQGQLDDASSQLERARQIAAELGLPEDEAEALGNLAALALDRGDTTTAESDFEQALRCSAASPDTEARVRVLANIASTYLSHNRQDEARRFLDRATGLERSHPLIMLARAELALSSRSYAAAASLLQQVQRAAPELWSDRLQGMLDAAQQGPRHPSRRDGAASGAGSNQTGSGWSEPRL